MTWAVRAWQYPIVPMYAIPGNPGTLRPLSSTPAKTVDPGAGGCEPAGDRRDRPVRRTGRSSFRSGSETRRFPRRSEFAAWDGKATTTESLRSARKG
ncbi:MAG: hypothetical protein MZU97_11995 [Bacillus subtilis]|nr:hypothetical protein [Bacillus subtilis]